MVCSFLQCAHVGDYSPAITLGPSEPRGIRQPGLPLTQGKGYTGRIVLAGDSAAQVGVSHPTESPQTPSLQIRNDALSGKITLRHMAPKNLTAVAVGQEPGVRIERQTLDALPRNPTSAPFSLISFPF